MTQVRYREDGGRFYLSAKGHAVGSPTGCAYISGILQSVAGYLVNEPGIRVEICRVEPGDVELRFRGGREARAAFQMAVIGLKQLEQSRGDLVRVEGAGGFGTRPYGGKAKEKRQDRENKR